MVGKREALGLDHVLLEARDGVHDLKGRLGESLVELTEGHVRLGATLLAGNCHVSVDAKLVRGNNTYLLEVLDVRLSPTAEVWGKTNHAIGHHRLELVLNLR